MKRLPRAFVLALCLVLCCTSIFALSGCGSGDGGYQKNSKLNTSEKVTLRIVSSTETWPEMDSVITKFSEIYPNCTIVYEYIEQYADNLPVRLSQSEQKVDIFRSANVIETTPYREYALNLISDESKEYLDLSGANAGLVNNFKYVGAENTQYAIPYGGEMRGMYVNKTLLAKYGLEVPTNREELVRCCEVLYAEGYVPLQSAPGTFAQHLLYPYICNSIVNGGNYEKDFAAIENIDPGVSEYLRDAYTFLYNIVEKGYFDYKRVEDELGYKFTGKTGKAMDFLNITKVSEEVYEKQDDVGKIAFMPDTQGFDLELARLKADYHSEIEYEFILSPVGEDGGVAYLSPADGISVNNRSDHIDWALEFLNFFFTPEVNIGFAEEAGKIPNTADALLQYNVDAAHTCDVGQMTFSNYNFYKTITPLMMDGYEDMIGISKMNAQKYMTDNGDGTYSITYTLEDYMARLEAEFQALK